MPGTHGIDQRADTFLALFDANGTSLLAANDDHDGAADFSSRIVWQAPAAGTYAVRVSNRAALTGCTTDYELWLEELATHSFFTYLPLVIKNAQQTPSQVVAESVARPRLPFRHPA